MRQAAILSILLLAGVPASAQLPGAWSPEAYVLADGTELSVSGLIFFTDEDWTVLFFVTGNDGEPVRGSGEGGTYSLDGERLTFRHNFHMSAGASIGGLPEAPLRMNVRDAADAASEPCRIELGEDSLTIHFPSGNRMDFRRSSS